MRRISNLAKDFLNGSHKDVRIFKSLNGSTLWNILELGETLDPKDRNSKDNSIHHNVDTSSRSSSVLM